MCCDSSKLLKNQEQLRTARLKEEKLVDFTFHLEDDDHASVVFEGRFFELVSG